MYHFVKLWYNRKKQEFISQMILLIFYNAEHMNGITDHREEKIHE